MKHYQTAIALLCFALIALLLIADIYFFADEPQPGVPPERDWGGLKVQKIVALPEPEYEMYFTEADIATLAQMLYGEARGCSIDNQMKACWCVLNRVDDSRFPNSIIGVVSASGQFYGYSPNHPVWDNLYEVAEDVLIRWSLEKQGVCVNRELPETYLWFTGNGAENVFREVY